MLPNVLVALLALTAGRKAPSLKSPVVDEEKIKPGQWMVSSLSFLQYF